MADASYEDIMNAEKAVTMKETDRKCPECGGVMDFDPATGGLYCPFCDHREEIPAGVQAGEDKAEELDFDKAEHTGNCDWGVSQKTVTCKSCGAVSVYDALSVASECPYCGSNQVMEANDISTLAPNGVVPFALSAKEAGEKFMNWLGKKWFAPKAAKQSAKADAFKGIYLPYWTFDADTHSTYSAEYGIDHEEGEGDKKHTVTDWHKTRGTYDEFINDKLVCGSTTHDEGILGMIVPFKTEENKAYKPEYMAGFGAERYSVGLKDAWEKAKAWIKTHVSAAISSKIVSQYNADRTRNLVVNTTYSNITYKYLMLPIWISAFQYNGKTYQFMVNGQTGKVGGKYPVSAWRVLLAILIVVAIFALLYFLNH